MYHRLGHVNQVFVKVGDTVKRGDKIATNGTGNGQWFAHCHYDIFKEKQANWERYNIGWSKEDTLKVWVDPTMYIYVVMPTHDHFGWKWMEYAKYGSGYAWHPGADLNGPGTGNADLDAPLHSPVDGVIEYIYDGNGNNSGWGRLIVVKEVSNNSDNDMTDKEYYIKSDLRNVLKKLWKDFDHKKKADHVKMAFEVDNHIERTKEMEEEYSELLQAVSDAADSIEVMEEKVKTANDKNTNLKIILVETQDKLYKAEKQNDMKLENMTISELVGQIIKLIRKKWQIS